MVGDWSTRYLLHSFRTQYCVSQSVSHSGRPLSRVIVNAEGSAERVPTPVKRIPFLSWKCGHAMLDLTKAQHPSRYPTMSSMPSIPRKKQYRTLPRKKAKTVAQPALAGEQTRIISKQNDVSRTSSRCTCSAVQTAQRRLRRKLGMGRICSLKH